MPVKACDLNRSIVFTAEFAFHTATVDPEDQANTYQYVKGVNAGHHIIDTEEYRGFRMFKSGVGVPFTREDPQFKLV